MARVTEVLKKTPWNDLFAEVYKVTGHPIDRSDPVIAFGIVTQYLMEVAGQDIIAAAKVEAVAIDTASARMNAAFNDLKKAANAKAEAITEAALAFKKERESLDKSLVAHIHRMATWMVFVIAAALFMSGCLLGSFMGGDAKTLVTLNSAQDMLACTNGKIMNDKSGLTWCTVNNIGVYRIK